MSVFGSTKFVSVFVLSSGSNVASVSTGSMYLFPRKSGKSVLAVQ